MRGGVLWDGGMVGGEVFERGGVVGGEVLRGRGVGRSTVGIETY